MSNVITVYFISCHFHIISQMTTLVSCSRRNDSCFITRPINALHERYFLALPMQQAFQISNMMMFCWKISVLSVMIVMGYALSVSTHQHSSVSMKSTVGLVHALENNNYVRVKRMLENGKDVNQRRLKDGQPLLFIAIQHCDLQMLNLLIEFNVRLGVWDSLRNNALHLAVIFGKYQMIETLLKHGDLGIHWNIEGLYPIHTASLLCRPNEMRALLNPNFEQNVNVLSVRDRFPPLSYAVFKGCRSVAQILLDHGADINEHSHLLTPLAVAQIRKNEEFQQFLLQRGALTFGPHSVYSLQDVESWWQYMLLNSRHVLCKRLLDMTIPASDIRVIRRMLELGALPTGGPSHTSILWACLRNDLEIVSLILDYGADPNGCLRANVCPIHIAIERGSGSIVRILLEKGANPNTPNKHGRTPLELARRLGNQEVVKILEDFLSSASL